MDVHGPIFVGGTGRSGTTIMADLLNSHPDIVLAARENKLIVEKDGLRDLVGQLAERFDMKRRHYAVANFVGWALRLRSAGFRDPALQQQMRALSQAKGIIPEKAWEMIARANPAAYLSIHAVGSEFGLEHYDRCVTEFVDRLCASVVQEGILVTEGLVMPLIIPKAMDRRTVLGESRRFLDSLYAPALVRASAVRWCDDTPSNWLYLDFLYELYPEMKFVHMIRDPRDVVGSYVKQVWAPADPRAIVGMFKAQFADHERIRSQIPEDRWIEIRLEDLSRDKAGVLDRLGGFLGVANRFDGSLFAPEKTNTGTYAESLGEATLGLIETELGDWMESRGYRRTSARRD
jgi:hypothetical protein